ALQAPAVPLLLATIVFLSVVVLLTMPPTSPDVVVLPLTVLLVRVSVPPKLLMPPPLPPDELRLTVLLVRVTVVALPKLKMRPPFPERAELSLTVLLVRNTVPSL